MTTQAQLAYIAGFLDGEGTIMFGRRARKIGGWELVVKAGNTNLAVLEHIQSLVGGRVRLHRRETETHKACYIWVIGNRQAGKLLPLLVPHLRVKRAQAELAIRGQALIDQYKGGPNSPVFVAFVDQMHQLNQRGPKPIAEGESYRIGRPRSP